MYLTRLSLDPRNAQARRDLGNPYDMHRTLVRAFVADEQQTPPRFLWRLEPQISWSTPPVLLVQSEQAADWSHLQALPNYLKQLPESKDWVLDNWLAPKQRYQFRLFANPTVTREGKRYGVSVEKAQLAWIARQGERHGFAVEAAIVTASDILKPRKQQTSMSLQRACYEGILQATDTTRLQTAVKVGIGPGKAFGCSLLSLARV